MINEFHTLSVSESRTKAKKLRRGKKIKLEKQNATIGRVYY